MNFKRVLPAILVSVMISQIGYAEPITVGFVGSHGPEGTVRTRVPLLDYLSREVGVPFRIVFREEYGLLVDALTKGEIDMFESGISSHISAYRAGNGDLLAGEVREPHQSKTYNSIFIVRRDSDIHSLADLKGKNLALTDELSISGYVLPRLTLSNAGIDDPDSFFQQIVVAGWHDRAIEAVMEKAVDVAAIGSLFFDILPKEKREKLRIIATSDPIPCGVFTIRRNIDPKLRQGILKALLEYKNKVPDDIRKLTEIDEFLKADEINMEMIMPAYNAAKSLPKLAYATPYQRLPTVFSERMNYEKRRAVKWMSISFALFAIILVVALFSFRRRIAVSVGLSISIVVALLLVLVTAFQLVALFSGIDVFATNKLSELQNLNLRIVAGFSGASSEKIEQIIANTKKYEIVTQMRVFRNGEYVASSDPKNIGGSIVERVNTSTFSLSNDDVVEIFDPIIVGNKKYATLQVGVSFLPIAKQVNNAIAMNIFMLIAALLCGTFAFVIVRKKLSQPLGDISKAVDGLREGKNVAIFSNESEVKQIASNIARLGKELEDKEALIELKVSEIEKPTKEWDPVVTGELLERIQKMESANEEFHNLRKTQALGNSPSFLRTLRDAAIRARDKDPVVIIGPTGSGKTGVARAIHTLSPRADQPFGEFNCAEFASADPMIVLGKLFGYGTDSGLATVDRKGQRGILEEYDGGTLFFDEVGLLPIQAQQLLLLPFEGRPFNPAAGKGKARTVNIRFIFATNERLEDLVHAGRMRHDLLRRIKARGTVEIAPLAERREDIEMLAGHFLAVRNLAMDHSLSFASDAMQSITRYGFDRYNVSELKGVVDQAFDNALFEESKTIELRHLGQDFVPNVPLGGFDDGEQHEISALRAHQFNITRAERHMGFATGSKTLTNRFRGICYKTLERCDWDAEKAAAEIAGPHLDGTILDRIEKKITDYLEMARRHVETGTTDKLFNNLPQKYHATVEKLLDAVRSGRLERTPPYET